MNIFVTDLDPVVSAQNLCDKHVVKMLTESVQLLSNALRSNGRAINAPYEYIMPKHPASLWASQSRGNYCWLYDHACAIYTEYRKRYGNKVHKAGEYLEYMHPALLSDTEIFPGTFSFVNCTPYKDMDNVVSAYRRYYIEEKSRFAKWAYSNPPQWYLDKKYE